MDDTSAGASAPNGGANCTLIVVAQPQPGARTLSGGSLISNFTGAAGIRIFWDPPTTGIRFQLFDGGPASRIVDRNITLAQLDAVLNLRRSLVITCTYRSTVEMVTRISGIGETIGGPFTGYTSAAGDVSVLAGTGSGVGAAFYVSAIVADDTTGLTAAQRTTVEAAIIDDLEQGRFLRSNLISANEIYWDARDCDYTLNTWPVRRGTASALAKNFSPVPLGFSARF
jgi:hypothetical protein